MFVLNGNREKILKMLKSCGLTEYESKAYFTLLLTGKSRAWDLSRKSSVPHSKIYCAVDELEEKGLAYTEGWKPKIIYPVGFKQYLDRRIVQKQKEIKELKEIRSEIGRTISSLKPVVVKFKDRYGVFEPKYRRKV